MPASQVPEGAISTGISTHVSMGGQVSVPQFPPLSSGAEIPLSLHETTEGNVIQWVEPSLGASYGGVKPGLAFY